MSENDDSSYGDFICPLSVNGEWAKHVVKSSIAVEQINEMHSNTKHILDNTKHLAKLDALVDIRDSLISYVVGKDSVSTQTVNELFAQQHKTFRTTQIVTGIVVVGLIGVIVFLLTGEHFGWIHQLFKSEA